MRVCNDNATVKVAYCRCTKINGTALQIKITMPFGNMYWGSATGELQLKDRFFPLLKSFSRYKRMFVKFNSCKYKKRIFDFSLFKI